MNMHRLSPMMASRPLAALAFVERFYFERGSGPSYGEIANALCVSRKHALKLVERLVQQGRLRRTPGLARSLRPLTAEEEAIRRIELAGYQVTNRGLLPPPDLDYAPGHGEEEEEDAAD